MPLPPSRRDVNAPPKRDLSSLASRVRHHDSALRSLNPGVSGRLATPRPVAPGSSMLVGGADNGGDGTTYEWQWDDRGTELATGTQVFTLTYEPVEESLFVRWHPAGLGGSVPMINENFTIDGRTVTIPDPLGLFAAGDRFSFQYQFDPGLAPEPASILFVGATLATAGVSSMALPPGTQVGDLLVLGGASADTCTCSDSRMTGNAAFAPWGPGAMVRWGLTSSATAPVICSVTGGPFDRAAVVLSVYRGVTVDSFSTQQSLTNDITLPVLPDAFAALGVLLNWEGVVHGGVNPDSTANWTADAVASASKNNVNVNSWSTAGQSDTPAGAFHHGGDWAGFTATTLRLVSTS